MNGFVDDARHPGVRVWQTGRWRPFFSAIAAFLLGAIAVGMGGLAVWVIVAVKHGVGVGLFLALVALVQGALVAYLWRDRQGRMGGRIAISDAGVDLALPANRSLIHRPPACRETLAWHDLTSVTSRLEVYGAQGMAMLQRPYWLVTNDGRRILLFEERAIDTGLQDAPLAGAAVEIAARGGLASTELPMAQGQGGLFGAWFAKPPPFDGPPLDPGARDRLMRRVWITGALAGLAFVAVLVGTQFG